jgi:exodeoxyribonuclease VII small subunit
MSFEKGIAELQSLVSSLDEDKLSLEDSIKSFEKGMKIKQYCERKLKDAENRVKLILDQTDPQ